MTTNTAIIVFCTILFLLCVIAAQYQKLDDQGETLKRLRKQRRGKADRYRRAIQAHKLHKEASYTESELHSDDLILWQVIATADE